MAEVGGAVLGLGEGERRAVEAAEATISNPLLDDVSLRARGVLINAPGGPDVTLLEVDAAAMRVREEIGPDTPTLSPARSSTRRWRAGCGSRWAPPGSSPGSGGTGPGDAPARASQAGRQARAGRTPSCPPAQRWWTKTSKVPLEPPLTSVSADEAKATKRPSAESDGALLSGLSAEPPGGTLTCVVLPAARSRTRM